MLYIIQNDPEVPAGNIIDHLSVPHFVCQLYNGDRLPDVADISAIIVLGGAMGAGDDHLHPFLADLKALIGNVVSAEIPYLGICLGGQLLAAAVGGRVEPGRWEEVGNLNVYLTDAGINDPLFNGLPAEFRTFQWHHDSFDIPEGGVLLASSEACPNQAFRVGRAAWGLQFHPEVTERIIRDWCAWESLAPAATEELIAGFSGGADSYCTTSRLLIENFIQSYDI
ncbi:MAG: type 1 glutamine amidotransferase [Geobacteraceae bacterium]|nr:type 1 glutamine amidotransferase [Geobacteraceae bacterium]NTW79701.1 type 1 glutamine amidotransferase [Geobacteraceae bacterium]